MTKAEIKKICLENYPIAKFPSYWEWNNIPWNGVSINKIENGYAYCTGNTLTRWANGETFHRLKIYESKQKGEYVLYRGIRCHFYDIYWL